MHLMLAASDFEIKPADTENSSKVDDDDADDDIDILIE